MREDLDQCSSNMDQTFMKEGKKKNELDEYLAEKLIKLHSGSQLLVAALKDTILCSFEAEQLEQPGTCITRCQSEEAGPKNYPSCPS